MEFAAQSSSKRKGRKSRHRGHHGRTHSNHAHKHHVKKLHNLVADAGLDLQGVASVYVEYSKAHEFDTTEDPYLGEPLRAASQLSLELGASSAALAAAPHDRTSLVNALTSLERSAAVLTLLRTQSHAFDESRPRADDRIAAYSGSARSTSANSIKNAVSRINEALSRLVRGDDPFPPTSPIAIGGGAADEVSAEEVEVPLSSEDAAALAAAAAPPTPGNSPVPEPEAAVAAEQSSAPPAGEAEAEAEAATEQATEPTDEEPTKTDSDNEQELSGDDSSDNDGTNGSSPVPEVTGVRGMLLRVLDDTSSVVQGVVTAVAEAARSKEAPSNLVKEFVSATAARTAAVRDELLALVQQVNTAPTRAALVAKVQAALANAQSTLSSVSDAAKAIDERHRVSATASSAIQSVRTSSSAAVVELAAHSRVLSLKVQGRVLSSAQRVTAATLRRAVVLDRRYGVVERVKGAAAAVDGKLGLLESAKKGADKALQLDEKLGVTSLLASADQRLLGGLGKSAVDASVALANQGVEYLRTEVEAAKQVDDDAEEEDSKTEAPQSEEGGAAGVHFETVLTLAATSLHNASAAVGGVVAAVGVAERATEISRASRTFLTTTAARAQAAQADLQAALARLRQSTNADQAVEAVMASLRRVQGVLYTVSWSGTTRAKAVAAPAVQSVLAATAGAIELVSQQSLVVRSRAQGGLRAAARKATSMLLRQAAAFDRHYGVLTQVAVAAAAADNSFGLTKRVVALDEKLGASAMLASTDQKLLGGRGAAAVAATSVELREQMKLAQKEVSDEAAASGEGSFDAASALPAATASLLRAREMVRNMVVFSTSAVQRVAAAIADSPEQSAQVKALLQAAMARTEVARGTLSAMLEQVDSFASAQALSTAAQGVLQQVHSGLGAIVATVRDASASVSNSASVASAQVVEYHAKLSQRISETAEAVTGATLRGAVAIDRRYGVVDRVSDAAAAVEGKLQVKAKASAAVEQVRALDSAVGATSFLSSTDERLLGGRGAAAFEASLALAAQGAEYIRKALPEAQNAVDAAAAAALAQNNNDELATDEDEDTGAGAGAGSGEAAPASPNSLRAVQEFILSVVARSTAALQGVANSIALSQSSTETLKTTATNAAGVVVAGVAGAAGGVTVAPRIVSVRVQEFLDMASARATVARAQLLELAQQVRSSTSSKQALLEAASKAVAQAQDALGTIVEAAWKVDTSLHITATANVAAFAVRTVARDVAARSKQVSDAARATIAKVKTSATGEDAGVATAVVDSTLRHAAELDSRYNIVNRVASAAAAVDGRLGLADKAVKLDERLGATQLLAGADEKLLGGRGATVVSASLGYVKSLAGTFVGYRDQAAQPQAPNAAAEPSAPPAPVVEAAPAPSAPEAEE